MSALLIREKQTAEGKYGRLPPVVEISNFSFAPIKHSQPNLMYFQARPMAQHGSQVVKRLGLGGRVNYEEGEELSRQTPEAGLRKVLSLQDSN